MTKEIELGIVQTRILRATERIEEGKDEAEKAALKETVKSLKEREAQLKKEIKAEKKGVSEEKEAVSEGAVDKTGAEEAPKAKKDSKKDK